MNIQLAILIEYPDTSVAFKADVQSIYSLEQFIEQFQRSHSNAINLTLTTIFTATVPFESQVSYQPELPAVAEEYPQEYPEEEEYPEKYLAKDFVDESQEKFVAVMKNTGDKPLEVVKYIKTVLNLGLSEAKNLVDSVPFVIGTFTKNVSQILISELGNISNGVVVELYPQDEYYG